MFSDLVIRRQSPPVCTRRTCAKSFRPNRNASPRQCAGTVGSWRNTWATACSSISGIPRTTPSGRASGAGVDRGGHCSPVPLQTRVSIAIELVVVGDLIGSGEAQEHPRTSRRACKGSPSRTWWSSPKEPGDFLAICLSSRTWAKDLKGVALPCEPGGAASEFGGRPLRGIAHGG